MYIEDEQEKIVVTKDGKEVECDVLFTFTSEDTYKGYIAFSDHSKNDKGEENIYFVSFMLSDPDTLIYDFDEAELAMFNNVIENIKKA